MANTDQVTLVLHYQGSFLRDIVRKTQKYVGGIVNFFVIDRDRCCFIDLIDDIVGLTKIAKEKIIICYKYPDVPLYEAVGKIENDQDLIHLLDLNKGDKGGKVEFDVFVTTRDDERRQDKKKDKQKTKKKIVRKKKIGSGQERQQVMEGGQEIREEGRKIREEGQHVRERDYISDHHTDDLNYESHDSCEVESVTKRPTEKGILFDDHGGIEKVDLFVGLEFKDRDTCKKVFRQYAIDNHFNMILPRNEKRRVLGICTGNGCPWRCYAAGMQDGVGYIVRKLEKNHTCGSNEGLGEKSVTQGWTAEKIKERIKSNPKQSVKSINADIHREYGIPLNYYKIWRGKNDAMDRVFGRHEESFQLLPSLCATLKKTNPGTVAEYTLSANGRFERLFVCFMAWKEGFLRACRPYIGLDGCFLKGKYKGILLSAISNDAENGTFPLAIAVVEAENADSWLWFLLSLKEALGYRIYTFMSDRQKGLIDALHRVFPECPYRYCVRHLYANLKCMEFGRGILLRDTFWAAARAYTIPHYQQQLHMISQFAPQAHNWITQIPGNHWSRAFFSDELPSNQIENNTSESWNSYIGDLRSAAICELVDDLRRLMMERFQKRREKTASWTQKVVPRVVKQIEETMAEARRALLIYAGEDEYEVEGCDDRHTVFVTKRICTCRRWQVDGIPCKHALAVCINRRDDPHNYCSDYLSVDAYRATYEGVIHSMPDRTMWEKVDSDVIILPPKVKRAPGRPKKKRKKGADETPSQAQRPSQGQTVRCSQCNALGHNKKTCGERQRTSSSQPQARRGKLPITRRSKAGRSSQSTGLASLHEGGQTSRTN